MSRSAARGRLALTGGLGLALALGLGLGLGCRVTRDNPDHCWHARGDATCLERYPDASLPYCVAETCSDAPFGCVAELPEPGCYSPCGGEALLGEGECELADSESGSESGGETETSESSGTSGSTLDMLDMLDMAPGPECSLDSDCLDREGTRFCIEGSCQPCTNMPDPGLACATRDPSLPVCHDDECVTCFGEDQAICTAQAQICVAEGTSCGPCTNHDQCPGGAACHILDGVCLPADAVWHIDGDGGQDLVAIDSSIAAIGAGEAATFILHELDGGSIYQDRVFMTGQTIALIAAPGEHPSFREPQDLQTVIVVGGVLYLRGAEIRGSRGVMLAGQARAHVDSSEVYASSGPTLEVFDGAHLLMRNSMVRGGVVDPALLVAWELGGYEVVDSTLVGFGANLLRCPTLPTASSLRSSILVSLDGAELSDCAGFSINLEGNALSKAIAGAPANTIVGGFQSSWFADGGSYDLHLTTYVPISLTTAATWKQGDPLTDFDGDPRPIGEDLSDWAGADVPSP